MTDAAEFTAGTRECWEYPGSVWGVFSRRACCHAVLLFLLGIDVRWHNEALIPVGRHVLASNHVTTGDLMMLYKRPQRYVHLVAPGLPRRVTEV